MKSNKTFKISQELIKDLNHWRDKLIEYNQKYYTKDLEKERTIKNMLNKYLDDALEYNKKNKEPIKK